MDDEERHDKNARERLQGAMAWMGVTQRLAADGLEPNGAGIHFIQPYPDPYEDGLGAPLDPFQARNGYHFWAADPVYPDVLYRNPHIVDPVVPASSMRIFDNDIMDYFVIPEEDGEYSVIGKFTQAGEDKVARFITPDSPAAEYADWYGIRRSPGESPTPLVLTVVSEGRAFEVFHGDQVSASLGEGYTVVLARDLSDADAHELRDKLKGV
tara:strand:+ start:14709 stop:15341 length:633 start_codon:yes stop_codon:yes gene_type:complete